jgi:hypothetical protein
MRTLEDYPDGEFFARHTWAVLSFDEKGKIFVELCRLAKLRGSAGIHDIADYLHAGEWELLVTMIGKRIPISDEELENALLLFFLSNGESAKQSSNPACP